MPAVVGSQSWQLSLPGCTSLKEKRSVIRSLKDRIRHKYNVSVAETASQDAHARAELSVALVSNDARFVGSVLDKIDRLLQENGRAVILGSHRDVS